MQVLYPYVSPGQRRHLLRNMLPRVLYKYLKSTDVHFFFEEESIRVGTLVAYRDCEEYIRRHGRLDLRVDCREGMGSFVERQTGGPQTWDQLSPFMQRIATGPGGRPGGIGYYEDNTVVVLSEVRDCHVYCTSLELSRSAADKYDACLEIPHPAAFAEAVSQALMAKLGHIHLGFAPVTYRSRDMPSTEHGKVDLAFVKDPVPFAVEREFRFIWTGDQPPPERYVDVPVPGLASLVRRVPIP